jgi:hypothetical protein
MVKGSKRDERAAAEVARLIAQSKLKQSEVARELTKRGFPVTAQAVGKWIKSGQISRENLEALRALTERDAAQDHAKPRPALEDRRDVPNEGSLARSRDKNDLLAIWYVLEGFGSYLQRTRQDEAEGVAAEIVALAGVDFSKQGFVNTLVARLLGVEHASEVELKNLLLRPTSSRSKREHRQVK